MANADRRSELRIVENDATHDSSELERVCNDLHTLRRHVMNAWQARGVLLTAEERRELRDEIRETCALLEELTVVD